MHQLQRSWAFDPSIRRHSGIWGAADEAVLNIVRKKIPQKYLKKNLLLEVGPLESTMLCATAPLSTSCLALSAMPPSSPLLTSSTSLQNTHNSELVRIRAVFWSFIFAEVSNSVGEVADQNPFSSIKPRQKSRVADPHSFDTDLDPAF